MDELNEEWDEKEQGSEKAAEKEEEEEEEEVEEAPWPRWLKPLLQTSFFTNCNFHGEPNNMYCLDCMNGALCSSCLIPHRDHHFIQIRRSSYHDVIRVSEIQKVLDISGVQTYVINGARVVFLNQRPQLRPAKAVSNTCRICDRSLLDSSYYCSLGCKASTFLYWFFQLKITGTSGSHRRKQSPQRHSEAGDSSSGCRKVESATVPSSDSRREKRRKGTPHRAPMGCC
ncbi:Uncharacterized protein EJ110_NYTH08722 [Nymphaea thermarum]|nr:Uncharacterized protein EJ110_NYTH08722 [Nymphaea thermarum]